MSRALVDRIPFAKIITVLAIAFGVALGMCGVVAAASSQWRGGERALMTIGIIDLVVMVLSAVGLVVTVIAWVILGITSGFGRKTSDPQKLFDETGETREHERE
jgi:ABC-type dipeptide/oligopeptide/nickel transport system permease component